MGVIDIKNFEKNIDAITNFLIIDKCDFIRQNVLKDSKCQGDCLSCEERLKQWLLEEYVEPEIDWLKVPVNTPVMVRDKDNRAWQERHFVCYMPSRNKRFMAFESDCTQETAVETFEWKYCKLADGVDPTQYLKEV